MDSTERTPTTAAQKLGAAHVLIHCPFCGGEARSDDGRNEPETRFVECVPCGAIIDGPAAYETWNKRLLNAAAQTTCAALPLNCDRDPERWAREFNSVLEAHGIQSLDEGLLIGWFANAMME